MFSTGKKQLAVLIDPENQGTDKYRFLLESLSNNVPDFVFVGGSITSASIDSAIEDIKRHCPCPVVLFPGNASQFSPKADALLYLSLISGRNPDYLIGQHVQSSMQIKASGIKVVPTGYILVESGCTTSVEYISGTKPIPRLKPSIAVATAMAGKFLGMQAIYLEAGSGASMRVPDEMIGAVKQNVDLPLITGGGLRTAEDVAAVARAGADVAVVGNVLEQTPEILPDLLQALALL